MLFKNIVAYRIGSDWTAPNVAEVEARLAKTPFIKCGATDELSLGWVPPRGQDFGALVELSGGHWLIKLQVEKKVVPGSALKAALQERCKELEEQRGKKVSGKEKKELKAELKLTMLPRAFSKQSTNLVWLDAENRFLIVGASSHKSADQVVTAIAEVFGDLGHTIQLAPLNTELSPTAAMSNWLLAKNVSDTISLNHSVELKQPSDKSSVKYANHNLELDEISQHIQNGKQPTKLALTWEDRVSFTFNEAYCLSKIEFLDVGDAPADDEDPFDTDAAIATTELSAMLPDLIQALGGEIED